jgi:hypothetical protein
LLPSCCCSRPSRTVARRYVRRAYRNGRIKCPKTDASFRDVPLQAIALEALDALPRRNGSALVFPAPRGGYLDLHNFRHRDWKPAQRALGIDPVRRIYDLRHSSATFALRAGISTFDLSRYMGASLTMIDRHYGHLAKDGRQEGDGDDCARRLGAPVSAHRGSAGLCADRRVRIAKRVRTRDDRIARVAMHKRGHLRSRRRRAPVSRESDSEPPTPFGAKAQGITRSQLAGGSDRVTPSGTIGAVKDWTSGCERSPDRGSRPPGTRPVTATGHGRALSRKQQDDCVSCDPGVSPTQRRAPALAAKVCPLGPASREGQGPATPASCACPEAERDCCEFRALPLVED